MAEFLIYNKTHWTKTATKEQTDSWTVNDQLRFENVYEIDDIVAVRDNGGYGKVSEKSFRVVKRPELDWKKFKHLTRPVYFTFASINGQFYMQYRSRGKVDSSDNIIDKLELLMIDVYVDPKNQGGTEDGDAWATAWGSLQEAETDNQQVLSEPITFHCKDGDGASPDTTATTFAGWTTAAANYILVQGGYAAGETGTPGTPERLEAYSTAHYRMTGTDVDILSLGENYCRIDGIQFGFSITANNAGSCFNVSVADAANLFQASNSIFKGVAITGSGAGRGIELNNSNIIFTGWNLLIYDIRSDGGDSGDAGFRGIWFDSQATANLYNSTINNCRTGIDIDAGAINLYNVVITDCDDDIVNAGTLNMYYCGTEDDDDIGGSNNFQITQAKAVLFAQSTADDFKVKDVSSELYNTGDGATPKSVFTDDIAGTTRGPADGDWDVGAFEFASGAGWAHKFCGASSPGKVDGVANASIAKVMGVAA